MSSLLPEKTTSLVTSPRLSKSRYRVIWCFIMLNVTHIHKHGTHTHTLTHTHTHTHTHSHVHTLTRANAYQKDHVDLQRTFSSWKLRHVNDKRESFTTTLAKRQHHRKLMSHVWAAWFGLVQGRWKQRVEKACQVVYMYGIHLPIILLYDY